VVNDGRCRLRFSSWRPGLARLLLELFSSLTTGCPGAAGAAARRAAQRQMYVAAGSEDFRVSDVVVPATVRLAGPGRKLASLDTMGK
jgi:hypothetical protein